MKGKSTIRQKLKISQWGFLVCREISLVFSVYLPLGDLIVGKKTKIQLIGFIRLYNVALTNKLSHS